MLILFVFLQAFQIVINDGKGLCHVSLVPRFASVYLLLLLALCRLFHLFLCLPQSWYYDDASFQEMSFYLFGECA